jgi:hypothetical protein
MSESVERNPPVLEREFVTRAIDDPTWDIGNRALYALCREFPRHERAPEIVAKVWLIGRSYAAAIERGQQSDLLGDDFYTEVVAPQQGARAAPCRHGYGPTFACLRQDLMKGARRPKSMFGLSQKGIEMPDCDRIWDRCRRVPPLCRGDAP